MSNDTFLFCKKTYKFKNNKGNKQLKSNITSEGYINILIERRKIMKKVAEINIKTNKSIDSEKIASKVKEIVEDFNNEDTQEFQNDLEDVVINMYEKDYSLKEIIEITGLDAAQIASIIYDYEKPLFN